MNLSGVEADQLLHMFVSSNLWEYFREGQPLASLVEEGRTLSSRSKVKKGLRAKDNWSELAFELRNLNLTCCDNGRLLRQGLCNIK